MPEKRLTKEIAEQFLADDTSVPTLPVCGVLPISPASF